MPKQHIIAATRARAWAEIDAMTEKELRAALASDGQDFDSLVAKVRKVGREARRKFAASNERREWFIAGTNASFPAFNEAVAAGSPAWLDASAPGDTLSLVDILRAGSADSNFWARVTGWSMRDEGIKDGDYLLVNAKREAKDGDVVLAHLQGQGHVVKRLRVTDAGLVLASANPDYADIAVEDPAALRIHGVVVGRAGIL